MTDLAATLTRIVGHSPLQHVPDPFPEAVPIRLYLKRDDLLHPQVSGNKWRKLHHNLLEARRLGQSTLLTFGGAYSNHLVATAAAGKLAGFQTIGLVRGHELAEKPLNSRLAFCREQGMALHFLDRNAYRDASTSANPAPGWLARFGPCYVLPEGGTNELALRGTAEIMPDIGAQLGTLPAVVACAVGTGGTLTGLIRSAPPGVQLLGVSALKGPLQLPVLPTPLPPWVSLRTDYHQGGYGRTTPELLTFMAAFRQRTSVPLDPVYTGKLLYALYDLARQGYFAPGATVVAVHTGGLWGEAVVEKKADEPATESY